MLSKKHPLFAGFARRALTMTLAFVLPFLVLSGLARAGALEVVLDNNVRAATTPSTPSKVERLMKAHDCSATGLPAGDVPVHSVVREKGVVRLTSFAEGWQMYAGDAPGTLVAVCRL